MIKKINLAALIFFTLLCTIVTFQMKIKAENINTSSLVTKSIPTLDKSVVDLTKVFNNPIGNVVGLSNNNKQLVVTNTTSQAGAIWGKYRLNLNYDFTLVAYMYFGDRKGAAADGMTFTMQNADDQISGGRGENLGSYGVGPQGKEINGVAIEFDTYHNADGIDADVPIHSTYDHTGIVDVKKRKHLSYQTVINPDSDDQLSNGKWYQIEILWTKSNSVLRYKLKTLNSADRFNSQDKSYKIDTQSLFGETDPSVFWGFTGATGASWSENVVAFDTLPQPSNQDVYWQQSNTSEHIGFDKGVAKLVVKRNALYNLWDQVQTKIDFSRMSANGTPDMNSLLVDGKKVTGTLSGTTITVPTSSINKTSSEVSVDFNLKSTDISKKEVEVNTTGTEHITGANGINIVYKDGKDDSAYLTVKEDKSSIKTKDSVLYVGESWNRKDNFVQATDEDGKNISWEDERITSNGANIDTSKPGVYDLKYSFKGNLKTSDSRFTVTVKEDKSSIKTKDSVLYVRESWTPKDNFVGATDEDGENISWEDSRINSNGANIDTSKPGVYNLKYSFKGKVKTTEETFKVIVKDDQTKLELQNVELFVGETWDPNSPFKDVKDKDGNILYAKDFTHYYIYPVGEQAADKWITKELNTEVVGNYEVILYHFPSKQWSTRASVTVKNIPITLSVPESHPFGEMQLGKNEKLYWDKKEKIKITNDGNHKWQLSVKLLTSNNQDFYNYIKFKEQSFTKDAMLIDSGEATKTVTDELTKDNFIYVDYSDVKQLRKDVATLEWALTPSTKELNE